MGKPLSNNPQPIVSYDPEWPLMFDEEKKRILDLIGGKVVAIEHVGSTAIPGMAAKPTIDILVALRRLGAAVECIEPLSLLGYEYRPLNETLIPGTRFFRKGPQGANTHHIRMVEKDSQLWRNYVLFRDYLRIHPAEAEEYAKLKVQLYAKYGRKLPLEAKREFIERVLDKQALQSSQTTASRRH